MIAVCVDAISTPQEQLSQASSSVLLTGDSEGWFASQHSSDGWLSSPPSTEPSRTQSCQPLQPDPQGLEDSDEWLRWVLDDSDALE